MGIEILYGIALVAAIIFGTVAYKNHWKIAD